MLTYRTMTGKRLHLALAAFCLATLLAGPAAAAPRPLQAGEVNGPDVLAVWQFQPGAELVDGKGNAPLTLRGQSRIVPDPVFGGALESFAYVAGQDKPHGAVSAGNKAPTPAGPFSLEAWVKLKEKPEDPAWSSANLIDKTYVHRTHTDKSLNKDYFFILRQKRQGETISLQSGVGLGDEVITFESEPIPYAAGTWRHLAFYYDGKGTGMLFADGQLVGKKNYPGKGPAAPSNRNIALAERTGSIYAGLPGYMAQVRISTGFPTQAKLIGVTLQHPFQRTVFERMEQNHALQLQISNLSPLPLTGLTLTVHDGLNSRDIQLGELPVSDTPLTVSLPLDCSGKTGTYDYRVEARATTAEGSTLDGNGLFTYRICRRLPEFMPVVMWGSANIEKMQQTGFTHSLHWMDHLDAQAWKAGQPLGFDSRFDGCRQDLNEVMAAGFRVFGKLSPGGYFKTQDAYKDARQPFLCYDRQGKPLKMVNFSLPRVQQFAFDVGRTLANNVGMYPVVDMVLTDSEFRDSSQLSFRDEDRDAFRAASGGMEIPDAIESKGGVKYFRLPDFPASRIIPENDPILTFYRWLWGGGDGFAGFLSESWRGLSLDGKGTLKAVWDPVVRSPSKWGGGGNVNMVGHWTYVYPDPLVMGLATDEVLAMCKGGPAYQEPFKMTQVIWYRSATTGPLPKDKSQWNEWEKRLPEARFITIPPDMLEIALWQKLSRPVKTIMYHGAGSLWDKGKTGGYDFTHPGTQPRLAALLNKVVKPFGPMLLKVPERQAQIAMLESFTSQMFYGGATFGNLTRPVGRTHAMLVRAHLQPEIVYDETIIRDGLDAFKVLVMPGCAVLSENVAKRIKAWQAAGGIIVADDLLAPGITPDVLFSQIQSADKEVSIATGRQLRAELDSVIRPLAEADSTDAILRLRSFNSTDYLFAFNDQRTYGDYVGQYRKVMEQGVPLQTVIRINRPQGTVYDLLAGKAVPVQNAGGALSFPASFGPGEGRLYMITRRPLDRVTLKAPDQAARGSRCSLEIAILDELGNPADAVVPLQVSGSDPDGQPLEIAGWHAAPGGKLTLSLDLAPNDTPGTWTLQVRELASGKEAKASLTVR